jgi:hypothetical protein
MQPMSFTLGRVGRDNVQKYIRTQFNEPIVVALLNEQFFHMQATPYARDMLTAGHTGLETREV